MTLGASIRANEISGEALTIQTSATQTFAGKIFVIDLVRRDAVLREQVHELRAADPEDLGPFALRHDAEFVPLRDRGALHFLGKFPRALAKGGKRTLRYGDGHGDVHLVILPDATSFARSAAVRGRSALHTQQ